MLFLLFAAKAEPDPAADLTPQRREAPAGEAPSLDPGDARFANAPGYAETRCRSITPDVVWFQFTHRGGPVLTTEWTLEVDGARVAHGEWRPDRVIPESAYVAVDVRSELVLRPFRAIGSVERRAQDVRLTRLDGQPVAPALDQPFTWVCERTSYPPRP